MDEEARDRWQRALSRRRFMRWATRFAAGAAWFASGCVRAPEPSSPQDPAAMETEARGADLPSTSQPLPTARREGAAPTDRPSPTPQQSVSTSNGATPAPETPTAEPVMEAERAQLVVARGGNPATITERAVAALGGIERFVKSGDEVIIKPNICVDYNPPEYAATTNPTVVATLVRLCLGAGARRVRVMDNPFGGTPESAYAVSGIAEAVKGAGGEMVVMHSAKYVEAQIPDGVDIKSWAFYKDVLTADVFINVPIAKHHSLARLTLGMKNLLGVIMYPGRIHSNLGQRIADLASRIRPTLTVVDAVRILMNHGPSGGNLDDVKRANTVIASPDFVAADARATALFDMQGSDISYIRAAAEMGLGTMDLDSIRIEELSV